MEPWHIDSFFYPTMILDEPTNGHRMYYSSRCAIKSEASRFLRLPIPCRWDFFEPYIVNLSLYHNICVFIFGDPAPQ